MIKNMIDKIYDVDESDATASYGKGEKREDYADAWKETGNAILLGLPGSGKAALAVLLAERIELDIITPVSVGEAVEILGGEKKIIVLDDSLVEAPAVQSLIHGAGKAFYLMADSKTLAARMAERDSVEDSEQLWRDMSARLAVMEPIFYSVLHFLLPAVQTPEVMVDDALEKVAY